MLWWHTSPLCKRTVNRMLAQRAGMFNDMFPKIVPFTSNVGKYGTAGQATRDSIIRRMRYACWITKAIDTHHQE
jgi:hypothetical protein